MSELSHGNEARRALAAKLDDLCQRRREITIYGGDQAVAIIIADLIATDLPTILAALRADPVRAAEEMETELHLALRDAEPTIMLTTISDGPAIELIIDERETAIRLYEALEGAVGPTQPAAEGGAE